MQSVNAALATAQRRASSHRSSISHRASISPLPNVAKGSHGANLAVTPHGNAQPDRVPSPLRPLHLARSVEARGRPSVSASKPGWLRTFNAGASNGAQAPGPSSSLRRDFGFSVLGSRFGSASSKEGSGSLSKFGGLSAAGKQMLLGEAAPRNSISANNALLHVPGSELAMEPEIEVDLDDENENGTASASSGAVNSMSTSSLAMLRSWGATQGTADDAGDTKEDQEDNAMDSTNDAEEDLTGSKSTTSFTFKRLKGPRLEPGAIISAANERLRYNDWGTQDHQFALDTQRELEALVQRPSWIAVDDPRDERSFLRVVYSDIVNRLQKDGLYEVDVPCEDGEVRSGLKKGAIKSTRDLANIVRKGVRDATNKETLVEDLRRIQRPVRVRRILQQGFEKWLKHDLTVEKEHKSAQTCRDLHELVSQMKSQVNYISSVVGNGNDFQDLKYKFARLTVACKRLLELTETMTAMVATSTSARDLGLFVERWGDNCTELKSRLKELGVSNELLGQWNLDEILEKECLGNDVGIDILTILEDWNRHGWKRDRRTTRYWDLPFVVGNMVDEQGPHQQIALKASTSLALKAHQKAASKHGSEATPSTGLLQVSANLNKEETASSSMSRLPKERLRKTLLHAQPNSLPEVKQHHPQDPFSAKMQPPTRPTYVQASVNAGPRRNGGAGSQRDGGAQPQEGLQKVGGIRTQGSSPTTSPRSARRRVTTLELGGRVLTDTAKEEEEEESNEIGSGMRQKLNLAFAKVIDSHLALRTLDDCERSHRKLSRAGKLAFLPRNYTRMLHGAHQAAGLKDKDRSKEVADPVQVHVQLTPQEQVAFQMNMTFT